MKKDKLTTVDIILLTIFTPALMLYKGFTLSLMWGWFVPYAFPGAPPINTLSATALFFMSTCIIQRARTKETIQKLEENGLPLFILNAFMFITADLCFAAAIAISIKYTL